MRFNRRVIGAVGIIAGTLTSIAVTVPAQAATANTVRYYVPGGGGHVGYTFSSNHGWVCDDAPDGRQIYADWTFGENNFHQTAPAHGHGCAGNYFSKHPKMVTVCKNVPHAIDPCRTVTSPSI